MPVSSHFCRLKQPKIQTNDLQRKILTKPVPVNTASIIPAINTAQLRLLLSLGTEINLLTIGSFSIK